MFPSPSGISVLQMVPVMMFVLFCISFRPLRGYRFFKYDGQS
ncbi:hypothetical protein GCWU000341_02213 [Oribacterium sp. oral taxon 078 str. F0262]|nr:hypothetical protein GCWU000341_02213 [Oribacterium sp. oral taxon 078 str. F0262]